MEGSYKHKKGNVYKILCVALNEADKSRVVVYQGNDGVIWCRPYDIFIERFEKIAE